MPKFESLLTEIRSCRVCAHANPPLPVEPNPVLQVGKHAKIRIIGQAPGTLAHASSLTFNDPSGRRLREWLAVTPAEFYNVDNFAVTPMGFCFPGQDAKGGDLPPRRECAPLWHPQLDAQLQQVELTLLVGMYAVKHVLGAKAERNLTETVRHWRAYGPKIMPLPHPSWRNNGWIKRHDWFAAELAELRRRVDQLVTRDDTDIGIR
ncbi:uracil-DNA glycosylase [Algimonas arctica]|uniref:Uracil-DNA glycosylase n=1 Tax=Algimonas arctica TaxID=1479486 RepID=A0A8J3CKH8_9PROT|nr:uracil-DNA glycosylase family protein [Algimonas arctica]GHA82542.1 uracil-DNA glycosylase [Algimonas arctica]